VYQISPQSANKWLIYPLSLVFLAPLHQNRGRKASFRDKSTQFLGEISVKTIKLSCSPQIPSNEVKFVEIREI
jgi:hypothetical protein